MGSSRTEKEEAPPGTARDGTRVEEEPPEAVRMPRPEVQSGEAEPTRPDARRSPDSQASTPRNVEPVADERSAPTVRRADRISRAGRSRRDGSLEPARTPEEGSEDTLLSAPAPADRFEVDVERRLEETERRLDQVEARLGRLPERRPEERPLTQNPLFWFVFLLAVAVAFLLLRGPH